MSTPERIFETSENPFGSLPNISAPARPGNDSQQVGNGLPDNLTQTDLAQAFTELKSLMSSLKEDVRLIAISRMRITAFMTTKEAARFYHVTTDRILALEESGLPFYDGIGKGHRYLMEDLILFRRHHRSVFNRRKTAQVIRERAGRDSAIEERIATIIAAREPDRFEEEP